jgi:NADPH-dependent 2,4-dienoyl-CoA reductase/sulfur reductase-like enzyme
MKRYLEWMTRKTLTSSVEVKLSTAATVESITMEKPDVLIVAVGAEPFIPDITGIFKPHVAWVGDVLAGKAGGRKTAVVVGAGLTGCETALYLAQEGKKVTVIDQVNESEIAKDAASVTKMTLLELLHEQGVEFRTEVTLQEITDTDVLVADKMGIRFKLPADSVVLSLGMKSRHETVQTFQGLAREVHVVGDCFKPRNLMAAIHDAFYATAEM